MVKKYLYILYNSISNALLPILISPHFETFSTVHIYLSKNFILMYIRL